MNPVLPSRRHRRLGGLTSLLVVAACSTNEASEVDDIRVGFGGGSLFASARVERDQDFVPDLEIDADWSAAGFVEAMIDGPVAVHLRAVGARTESSVVGTASSAEVRQGLLAALVSWQWPLTDTFALRPFVGVDVGYVSIAFSSSLIDDDDELAGGPCAGLELEVARHATIGVMGWSSLIGHPGDTEGTLENLLLYVGVRF